MLMTTLSRDGLLNLSRLILLFAGCFIAAPVHADSATQIQYLSGTGKDDAIPWDFYCTAGMQSGAWKKIPVPSCWELQGFGVYNYGQVFRLGKSKGVPTAPGFASEQGKYKTEFTVPADWQGKTIRIVFEGVMVKTEVFVNGHSVGPAHEGSFYEFKYNITPFLKFGAKNLLEVTVSKVTDDLSVMRAERQGDFWNFGGIYRPVYLEAMPADYIDWTGVDGQGNGDLKADIYLGEDADASNSKVSVQLLDAKGSTRGRTDFCDAESVRH